MEKYTFLAVAPCTFTVLGKHYSLQTGTPFHVSYEEAKIISSSNFRYRTHVRLITPLVEPKAPAKSEEEKKLETKSEEGKKLEAKLGEAVETKTDLAETQPKVELELEIQPIVESEVELQVQPIESTIESEPAIKRRRKPRETTLELEVASIDPINNEDLF